MEDKNRTQVLSTSSTLGKQADQAKTTWHKPEVLEISCGLEINCYATSTGRR